MLRRTLLFLTISSGLLATAAWAQAHLWSRGFGAGGEDEGAAVAVDASGNVVVTGVFQGTVDFGGGPLTSAGSLDIFVAKFDANGNHLWSLGFGDNGIDVSQAVAVDGSGNVVVTGVFQGTVDFGGGPLTSAGGWDIVVAKYDPNGVHVWSRRFGDSPDQFVRGIAVDAAGNVVATGNFGGTVDFGGGPLTDAGGGDLFVAKFDANGSHLWSQRFGDTNPDTGLGIAADGSGNVLVTGLFNSTVDFGGGPLTSAFGGMSDIFVAKFDPNGSHLWSQRFGDTNADAGLGVAVDGSGNVVVTGSFQGTVDFGGGPMTSAGGDDIFVAKFDANGSHFWSQGFGATGEDDGSDVAVDGSGNVVVAGLFNGTVDLGGGPLTSAGMSDIFVAKFDANGNHFSSLAFGDTQVDAARDAATDAPGNVVVTGDFQGTVDFGGGPLTGSGSRDIFVAKYGDEMVPVALQAYDSRWTGDHVEISWRLIDIAGDVSFDILREELPRGTFEPISNPEIDRRGQGFLFEDRSAESGRTYRYRVVIFEDGGRVTSFETEVATPRAAFVLHPSRPNPFNPTTRIDFSVDREARVILAIYDVAGKPVRTLVDAPRRTGDHSVVWDGRDDRGNRVASGIYTVLLRADGRALKQKAALLE